ncbi:hypothetical protein [Halorubrum halodurans]|uniref:Uncharacterized protein n=1 Tax=Halorubrum halodurans TaxID=1383851 RepID=A0A256ILM0_9EURY|nr:hypothetical protein [Halorubrum halodurans]OYR57460.1 hypothetical protein DJ70_05845 [Halorubrum halodurans]
MLDVSTWRSDVRREYQRTFVAETLREIDAMIDVFPRSVRAEARFEEHSVDVESVYGSLHTEIESPEDLEAAVFEERRDSWEASREFVESLRLLSGTVAVLAPVDDDGDLPEDGDEPVIETMWTVQLVDRRFETLQSLVTGSISGKAKSKIKSVFGWIRNTLSSISSRLWSLVSSHTSLREWSVTGGAGVSMFGLQGTADVSLTFGP